MTDHHLLFPSAAGVFFFVHRRLIFVFRVRCFDKHSHVSIEDSICIVLLGGARPAFYFVDNDVRSRHFHTRLIGGSGRGYEER